MNFELWRGELVESLREVEELDNRVFLLVHPDTPDGGVLFPFVLYGSVGGDAGLGSFGGEADYPNVRLEIWHNDAVKIDDVVNKCLRAIEELIEVDPVSSTDYYVEPLSCFRRTINLQLRVI